MCLRICLELRRLGYSGLIKKWKWKILNKQENRLNLENHLWYFTEPEKFDS